MKRSADRWNPKQGAGPQVPSAASASPKVIRSYNAPKIRFTATLGEEPEVVVALV